MDLIKQYAPKNVLDPFSGSGTTSDVCRELNVSCDSFDLNAGFDVSTDELPPKMYDLIFCHPPYFQLIRYSDNPKDLSNSETIGEFNERLSKIIMRLSEYLTQDGKLVVLIGNMRKNGEYYPLGAFLEVLHRKELKEELVKIQHNVSSESKEYASDNFVRIMHEKVLIFADFRPVTWNQLVSRALEELGGSAQLKDIYKSLERHPKTVANPTFKATIRRTLQESARQVDLALWTNDKTIESKSS